EQLVLLSRADRQGRGNPDDLPQGADLERRAAMLGVEREPTQPLVLGRHLLELGVPPGPDYARVLRVLHDAQDEGEFTDVAGGLAYLGERGLLPPRPD
ncbi:MAG TPA: hypothetical protein VFO60_02420, partial [Candidatus Dormibacteraeota bacterium]|nr:hypothetical protein [Candidatus Dormibacteraeota bacterium]